MKLGFGIQLGTFQTSKLFYFSYLINQIKVTSEISPMIKNVINIISALTLKFLISFFLSFEIQSINKDHRIIPNIASVIEFTILFTISSITFNKVIFYLIYLLY